MVKSHHRVWWGGGRKFLQVKVEGKLDSNAFQTDVHARFLRCIGTNLIDSPLLHRWQVQGAY